MINNDGKLLSSKAIEWLKSINFSEKSHEERMLLIDAAKIAYPNEDEDEFDLFHRILGLA